MRDFARLYTALDATTSTNLKLEAMQTYFSRAAAQDAAWAVYFLSGGKPRQTVPTRLLRALATEAAGLDTWMFDECYHAVGDLAETIALILPPPCNVSDYGLAYWIEERLYPLRGQDPELIRTALQGYWQELEPAERFVLGKLIGGGFRVGVSRLSVTRALAGMTGVDAKLIAQRLTGWTDGRLRPTAAQYSQLLAPHGADDDRLGTTLPYPFFLAHPLAGDPSVLGPVSDWQVEWKYDGIRAQLVSRAGTVSCWSRGEELITEHFPELAGLALPDGCVLDGEILVWRAGERSPDNFASLQKRIGRKALSAKMLAQLPVRLVAYDLLELNGVDLRECPLAERRQLLEQLVGALPVPDPALPGVQLSPCLNTGEASWASLATLRNESRQLGVEGMMIKQRDSGYGTGRTKAAGVWWKWKVDPYTIDAVLIYAQAGHGRRASLYTDYTFAVWGLDEQGEKILVPFTKAYSGLTDAEIRQVDQRIRQSTVERFGPVRSVRPAMVFEIGFEAIASSARHKAGLAVRFPRILRWRTDKPVEQADTLQTLQNLLADAGVSP